MREIEPGSPWTKVVHQLAERHEVYVLVTVLGVQGSTPRDSGTKMVVTGDRLFGSIGGGHLEHEATQTARELLLKGVQTQQVLHFALGANLGQCCGGRTSLLFEVFVPQNVNLMVFGAGHVGQALVSILAQLPMWVSWVDSRPGLFPGLSPELFPEKVPGNVKKILSDNPVDEVVDMPASGYYLILTHNHQLDYELCEAILARGDFRYLGLIGSDTKWARFRQKLINRGFSAALVDRISSPVGMSAVPGKQPMEVAVSIAGQLIHEYQADVAPSGTRQGVSAAELKQLIQKQEQSPRG